MCPTTTPSPPTNSPFWRGRPTRATRSPTRRGWPRAHRAPRCRARVAIDRKSRWCASRSPASRRARTASHPTISASSRTTTSSGGSRKRRNDPQPTSEAGMTAQLEMTDLAHARRRRHRRHGLRKSFGATPVLDGVDFTSARGTVFALLGANGSGKTTTINILTTLINADGGTASVAGFDVADATRRGPRAHQRDRTVRRGGPPAHRPGEPRADGRAAPRRRSPADRGGPARRVRSQRRGRPPPADLLGRDATPPRHRHEPRRATRRSSSSTSRRPGSTPRAGPTCI